MPARRPETDTDTGRPRRSRRSPDETQRRRDPERTRERILGAAVEEFGEHGFAGARVSRIAARAGVNAQLISYYFDGKAGLYRALMRKWRAVVTDISRPDRPLDQVAADYVIATEEHRSWARLMAWEALGGTPPVDEQPDEPDFLVEQLAEIRRRQAAGELAPDLDPAHVMLALFGAAAAPTLLPQIARRIVAAEPDSAEFLTAYRDQIARMVRHLAP
ncbi:TetR/AcrR family transcriptional regulator [Pseudonocardia acaciae]|uniref:TetR/AcrR family transcriptional regulator n=1 Tax=Pseudonocardia acaciae TaxID=551276 RepID=UPI0005619F35|nr:TetR family transcriptional regulator [Pseudonocardia acaciae]